jgi:hypothetical protein
VPGADDKSMSVPPERTPKHPYTYEGGAKWILVIFALGFFKWITFFDGDHEAGRKT